MNRKNHYKDIRKWHKACRRHKNRYYRKTAFIYGKRSWTIEEDRLVVEHAMTDHELSALIHRSVGAIQKRRCTLKSAMIAQSMENAATA